MNLNLRDKVVVVTGGAQGIGNAIVNVLANEGAKIVIAERNEKLGNEVIAKINKNGENALLALAELTDPEQCKNVIETTVATYGEIHAVVNNAGVNDGVGLENGNPQEFIRSIERNLTHYYSMMHYALPYLKKTKGAVVNIGSKVAVTGQGGTSGYAAANGGRNALTREWATELSTYGIRVNSVIVAECYTPLYKSWVNNFPNPEEKLSSITKKIPLGNRMTTSEEIANMVVFLLSDRSAHTTGQHIFVDGGYTHLDRSIT